MAQLYPSIEPFDDDFIQVSPMHCIHYEQCGHPEGQPILFIHGGPGGGINPYYRRFFNPRHYRVVLVDQRGCGRSTPYAELEDNHTRALINDFEKIRNKLNIDRWHLFGGSWGSTLALAYAQSYPEVVSSMILRGIFLGSERENRWIFEKGGASCLYPDHFSNFLKPIAQDRHDNLIAAYYDALSSDDICRRREAALAWTRWEFSIATLKIDQDLIDGVSVDDFSLAFARIESHYLLNHCFLAPNQLLDNMAKIADIPGIIIQGRHDVVCPVESAWQLFQRWPKVDWRIVADGAHSMRDSSMASALVAATDYLAGRHDVF